MKRFKVSLAVLAIVFAAASAFTSANLADPLYKIGSISGTDITNAVMNQSVPGVPNPTLAQREQRYEELHCPGAINTCFVKVEGGVVTQTWLGDFE